MFQKILSLLKSWQAITILIVAGIWIFLVIINNVNAGQNQTPLDGLPTDSSNSKIFNGFDEVKILDEKYNFLMVNKLLDGRKVFLVAPGKLDEDFYKDFKQTILASQLRNVDKNSYQQLFLYSDKTGLSPLPSDVLDLHDFSYNNQTYWIYIKNGNIYASFENLANPKIVNTSQYKLFQKIYDFDNQDEMFLEYDTAGFKSKILFKKNEVDSLFVQKTTFGEKIIKDAINDADDKMTQIPPLPPGIKGATDIGTAEYFYLGNGNFLVKTVSFSERFWSWNVYQNKLQLLADFNIQTVAKSNTEVTCSQNLQTCFIYHYELNKLYSFSEKQENPKALAVEKNDLTEKIDLNLVENFKISLYSYNLLQFNEETKTLNLHLPDGKKVLQTR